MARKSQQHILYTVGDIRDFLLAEEWDRPIPECVAPTECEKQVRHTYPQRESSPSQQGVPSGGNKVGKVRWKTRSARVKNSTTKDE